ncbi:MAG: hypothetical protein CVV23_07640 [Ignavibacteriae bacterium HGW-Ignavibacteriae-2]|nr:hypothetical protein [Bacteroidota bacterium]PKL88963.1 MAG: hypothetical protein CVV23_07640 [Ignavibacteriae bacterium HGW-Ignavibacteriae-2]
MRVFFSYTAVRSYSERTNESRLLMDFEVTAENLGISFIGLLSLGVTLFTGTNKTGSIVVYLLAGVVLIFLAVWSMFSITKDSKFLVKMCPLIKLTLASFYIWAALF